jgi:hypothetical protein
MGIDMQKSKFGMKLFDEFRRTHGEYTTQAAVQIILIKFFRFQIFGLNRPERQDQTF